MARFAELPDAYAAPGTPGEVTRAAALIRAAVVGARTLEPNRFEERARRLEEGLEAVPDSALIQQRYRDLVLEWALAYKDGGEWAMAEQVYQRGLDHDPRLGEAAVNHAITGTPTGI